MHAGQSGRQVGVIARIAVPEVLGKLEANSGQGQPGPGHYNRAAAAGVGGAHS
jgi:hypothetical protein